MQQLGLHSFPGNIRELRNILERARLFTDDGLIRPEHLPDEIRPVATVKTGDGVVTWVSLRKHWNSSKAHAANWPTTSA